MTAHLIRYRAIVEPMGEGSVGVLYQDGSVAIYATVQAADRAIRRRAARIAARDPLALVLVAAEYRGGLVPPGR